MQQTKYRFIIEVLLTKSFLCNIQILEICSLCGGLEMAPQVNKWSPLVGAHK